MQPERTLDRRFCVLFLLLLTAALRLDAQSLAGSKASMLRQSHQAHAHEYSYLRTSSQVRDFARRGLLVRVSGNSSYRVADASFPYARPEVKTFLERLGKQYRSACGERLVVTSLTRPTTRQPRNASPLSVHPTGMAVDLRRSARPACRAWLEKTLLTLEAKDVVEATRENHPPHYHVTVYPSPYRSYLAANGETGSSASSRSRTVLASSSKSYRVGRGDSLWEIAKRHGTSVARIKQANGMRSTRLKPGQRLEIPTATR
jgi:hypothetical protein